MSGFNMDNIPNMSGINFDGIANMSGIAMDGMTNKAGLGPPSGDDDANKDSKTIVHNDVKTAKEATENEIRDTFNELDKMEVAELFGSITEDFCKKIDNKKTMESFIEAFFKKINEHFYSDEAEKKKFAIELLYGIVNNKTLDNKKDNKKDTTVGGAADAATATTDAAATDATATDAAATDAAATDAAATADAATATAKNAATAIAVAKDTTDTDVKNTDTAATTDAKNTAAADETTTAADDTESDDDDDTNTVKNEIDKDDKPNAENVLAFLKKEIASLLKGAKPIGDDGKTTPNDRVRQIMQNKIDYILYDTIITKVGKYLNTMNNPREIFFGEDGIGKVISIEHNEQRLTDLKRILNVQLMCNKSIINLEQLKSMELDEYKENKDFEGFKEFINAIKLPEISNDGDKTESKKETISSEETTIVKESESSNDGDKTESNKETESKKETKNSEETKIVKELLETLSELYDVAAHLHELNDKSENNKNDYILERLNLKNVSDSEISGFLADVLKAIREFFNINNEKTYDGKNNPGNETTTGGSSRKKKVRKTKKIKSKSKRRTR